MQIKPFSEIFNDMKNYIISSTTKITDFNVGSIVSSILESVATQINILYTKIKIGYDQFLEKVVYTIFGFTRKTGFYASGFVQFSRSQALTTVTDILQGVKVQGGDYQYVTTERGAVQANDTDSSLIPIIALLKGVSSNVLADTIVTIVSVVPEDIVIVTNPAVVTGGEDVETNIEFQKRFNDYIIGLQRTNVSGLRTAIQSLDAVRSVSIVEHFPPVTNIYNATTYVDDGTGNMPSTLEEEIAKIVNGDGTPEYLGYRATGINIRLLPPTTIGVNYAMEVTVFRAEEASARIDVETVTANYTNGLLIGQKVTLTDLILAIRKLTYVRDVKITAPVDNVAIANDQIARYLSAIVTIIQYVES